MSRLRSLPKKLLRMNPIIVKEIRSRMRGPRAFITLTVMLLFMGGIMYAILQIILAQSRYMNVLSPQIGQSLFAALSFLMLFMICAVTPAVTASAISSEKEKQTYEMLMATPLSGTSIVWGKLISALSYVFLLLFAGVPLASMVFIFGGVSPGDMVRVLVVLLVIAVTFGVLGLFMSALFGRTGRSTIASFIVVLALTFGPLFLAILVAAVRQGEPPRWILAPSPISALSAALASSLGSYSGRDLFFALSGIFNTGINPISQTGIPRPIYHYSLPLYVLLGVTMYLLATRLIQPAHRWQIRRKEILLGLGVLLVISAIIVAGFFVTAPRYEWATNPNQMVDNGFRGPLIDPMMPPDMAVAVPQPMGRFDEGTGIEIYAEIVRRYYKIDYTFGDQPPQWDTLYLLARTDDSVGSPEAIQGDPVDLPEGITGGISKYLMDLPFKTIWVVTREDLLSDFTSNPDDNGRTAMILFGNPYFQEDGTVHVSAALYYSSLGSTGRTFILSNANGAWQTVGVLGTEWIE